MAQVGHRVPLRIGEEPLLAQETYQMPQPLLGRLHTIAKALAERCRHLADPPHG